MTTHIQVDMDVPLERTPTAKGFDKLVLSAAETVNFLVDAGLEFIPDQDDLDVAQGLAASYAEDPERTEAAATAENISKLTPASLILTARILRDFGHQVVQDSAQIRYLVTNKLIQESENPDPKIRLRALELLGKISDVGLFSEKTEVTITHRTTEDLRTSLRAKLAKLTNPNGPDAPPEDAVILDGEVLDVAAEMGLTPSTAAELPPPEAEPDHE